MTTSATHSASSADDGATHVVHAPARLHLGFVDLNGDLGRRFGSIGLAIEGLGTCARAAPAARLVVDAADAEITARVTALLTRLCAEFAPGRALHVGIETNVPAHAGLGSGTQLVLAVAQAAARTLGIAAPLRELARLGERGLRSGIGIAAFEGGGFVVDGGRGARTATPPLLARLRFPDEWRCVLVFDEARTGLSGQRERAAFARLAPMSEAAAGALARQVLVALLPALVERDFAAFSRAVAAVQRANGEYFAPAQGGLYTSAHVGELLAAVAREFGYTGIGQSSWGPTGFVFVPDAASAATVASFVDARKAEGLRCQIVTGNNVGARCGLRGELEVDPPPAAPVWLIPHQRRGY
ncbi:MAG TPA: GHMP kinase [Gammaproteobacteria bacterium]|nr:GHMP kinase [Gammaproteobacteria bacterium]